VALGIASHTSVYIQGSQYQNLKNISRTEFKSNPWHLWEKSTTLFLDNVSYEFSKMGHYTLKMV
jgi:hypothetical protein